MDTAAVHPTHPHSPTHVRHDMQAAVVHMQRCCSYSSAKLFLGSCVLCRAGLPLPGGSRWCMGGCTPEGKGGPLHACMHHHACAVLLLMCDACCCRHRGQQDRQPAAAAISPWRITRQVHDVGWPAASQPHDVHTSLRSGHSCARVKGGGHLVLLCFAVQTGRGCEAGDLLLTCPSSSAVLPA